MSAPLPDPKPVGIADAVFESTAESLSLLATLCRAGVLGKRRDSIQIYCRQRSARLATLCREVCTQVAIELYSQAHLAGVSAGDRLLPAGLRLDQMRHRPLPGPVADSARAQMTRWLLPAGQRPAAMHAPDQVWQAAELAIVAGRNARTKPYSSGPRVFLVWVQP